MDTPQLPITLKRAEWRAILEEDREAIAEDIAATSTRLRGLYARLDRNSRMWVATQMDEAPEFEVAPKLLRAAA